MNANGHGLSDLADTSIVKFQRPDNPHRGVRSGCCGGPQAGPLLPVLKLGRLAQLEAETPPCEPRHDKRPVTGRGRVGDAPG